MFKCQCCGKTPEKDLTSHEQEHKVILKARPKIYKNTKITKVNGRKVFDEFKTEGFETIQEISVCNNCVNKDIEVIKDGYKKGIRRGKSSIKSRVPKVSEKRARIRRS